MSAGDDYSVAVNANNLEIKNLTTNLKVYTDGESLWVPDRVFAGDTVYSVDSQLTGSQYFRYGLPSQFSAGVNINDNYQISDDTGSAVLEINKATGTTVEGLISQTGYTANLNSAIKTVNNPLAIGNPGVNAPAMTAVAPSTYTLVSGFWRFVSPSSTTGSMQFPPYFTTFANQKYILTLTGCSTNGTAPVVATVYNATTLTTISDAPKTITSTAQTITFTFTTGSSPCTVYINFSAGATNYYVQCSALSVQECDTEVIGSLILDSPIISNLTQATGTTTNLAGGLLVNQTNMGVSAATFTQTGVPATAPSCTLTYSAPTYTLAGVGVLATWLGAGTTYLTGAKYYFSFGTMFGSQALQLQVVQYNTAGSSYVSIGDYYYGVSTTSSTISGSFVPGSNVSFTGSILFMFVPTLFSQNVKFNTFTLTRADTQMTGVATLPPNAGTATSALGLNSSNQIVSYSAPSFSGVSVGYVPYKSATDTFSNSLITQSGNTIAYNNFSVAPSSSVGYTGASFTASTGIGSITYSAPTYTANSSASYQGIINLPALETTFLNLPCLATFTNLTFPLFAVAPYPYFTLTSGATVVYTSAVGASGTIAIPFTPTSSTLFITIYFKAPFTGFTGPVFTWNTFTMGVYTATMTGKALIGTTNATGLPAILQSSSSPPWSSSNSFGGASPLYPAQICAFHPGGQALYMGAFYTGGVNQGSVIQSSSVYSNADHTSMLSLNPNGGFVGVGAIQPTGTFDVQGIIRMGNYSGGSYDNIQFMRGTTGSEYPNIRCQDNYFGLYTTTAGGWVSDSQVGDMVMRPNISFRVGSGGASFLVCHQNTNVGIGRATPTYKLDINGNQRVYNQANGNDSMTVYGPNASWGAYLVVGSGTDRAGGATAQVISTNGNLHLDAGNSNAMYYGYYANSRGAPNQHLFFGSDIQFQSGIPQNTSPYSHVVVMDGNSLRRTQCVIRELYNSNSVAWGGGVNMTYAFYNYNSTVSVCLQGRYSGYWTSSYTAQMFVRIYNQNSGNYYTFTFNHVSIPLNCYIGNTGSGWNDVYVYSSGYNTDGNDQLQITVLTLPVNAY
jgi:hypothetical protein